MRRPLFTAAIVGVVLLWLVVISLGFGLAWRYTYTPGPAATGPADWPSTIARTAARPTLVMVLHPECACSTASLEELMRVVTRTPVPLEVLVLFSAGGDAQRVVDGALWRKATAIPGVTAVIDRDGIESRRFGALVSGQTFLFDRPGRLIFSGGITAGRGHAGDNDGETAVLAALGGARVIRPTNPVFGCLLGGSTAS
jgi:hypothetical protein